MSEEKKLPKGWSKDNYRGLILPTSMVDKKKLPQGLSVRMNGEQSARHLAKMEFKERMANGNVFPVSDFGLNTGAGDVQFTQPEIVDPYLNITNYYLPETQRVMNSWIRYYDRYHPVVGNTIDLHSSFPISRFMIGGLEDDKVQQLYEEMSDEINLMQSFLDVGREYHLLGEVFPYLVWDDDMGIFKDIIILNPDYIRTYGHPFANEMAGNEMQLFLEVDPLLKELIQSSDSMEKKMLEGTDPIFMRAVREGKAIPLDPFNVVQLARKASPYDLRGTSIVLRALKDLLYEDKLREAQYSIADRNITPLEVHKLGDPQGGYMPDDNDLAAYRDLLSQAKLDHSFSIIYHYGLDVQYYGYTGKVLPLIPEFDWVERRILTALFSNKALIHGEGPNYATSSVAMRALESRYVAYRGLLENWAIQSIFKPVAQAHQIFHRQKREITNQYRSGSKQVFRKVSMKRIKNENYEPSSGLRAGMKAWYKNRLYKIAEIRGDEVYLDNNEQLQLKLPEFIWRDKINLMDDTQQKNMMIALYNNGSMPFKLIAQMFGKDMKEVEGLLAKEKNGYFDPMYRKSVDAVTRDAKSAVKILQDFNTGIQKKAEEEGYVKEGEKDFLSGLPKIEPMASLEMEREPKKESPPPRRREPKMFEKPLEKKKRGPGDQQSQGVKELNRVIHNSSFCCQEAKKDKNIESRYNWQRDLYNHPSMNRKSRDVVIETENTVEDKHKELGGKILKDVLNSYQERGTLDPEGLRRILFDGMDELADEAVDVLEWGVSTLETLGVEEGKKRFSPVKEKKIAQEMLTRVKTLQGKDLKRVKEKILESMAGGPGDVVSSLIKDTVKELGAEATDEQVGKLVNKLWSEMAPIYRRIVRTETINATARGQLEEYWNAGVRRVRRNAVKDGHTCATCRDLDTEEFDLEGLLKLQYPVTEDPMSPGDFLSHPNCRCWFTPAFVGNEKNFNMDEIDLVNDPSTSQYLIDDLNVLDALIEDVPVESKEEMEKAVKTTDYEGEVQFVQNVTDTEEWKQDAIKKLMDREEGMEEKEAEAKIEELKKGLELVPSYETDEGKLLVSYQSPLSEPHGDSIFRAKARKEWQGAAFLTQQDLREHWGEVLEQKGQEDKFDRYGITFIGDHPFITVTAEDSPEQYFEELYVMYYRNKDILEHMDPWGYDFMEENFLGGKILK